MKRAASVVLKIISISWSTSVAPLLPIAVPVEGRKCFAAGIMCIVIEIGSQGHTVYSPAGENTRRSNYIIFGSRNRDHVLR